MWSMYWNDDAEIDPAAPQWKQTIETQNIRFYRAHRSVIQEWMAANPCLESFPASRRKFEWQAQDSEHDIFKLLIHLRPSGIRVKPMNYAPALVAMAQIPLLGQYGRRMTPGETSRLQSFPPDFYLDHQTAATSYKQLGNAINVGVAYKALRAHVLRDASDLETTEVGLELLRCVQESPDLPYWMKGD